MLSSQEKDGLVTVMIGHFTTYTILNNYVVHLKLMLYVNCNVICQLYFTKNKPRLGAIWFLHMDSRMKSKLRNRTKRLLHS